MTPRRFGFFRVRADIRYALQQLHRRPALSAVVILSLALGIGANTAIFSVVNAVMLRELPVEDPGNLLAFQYRQPGGGWPAPLDHTHSGRGSLDSAGRQAGLSISWPSFTYMRSRAIHSSLAGFVPLGMSDRPAAVVNGEPMFVDADMMTADCFPLLGVAPILGRRIAPGDETPGAARVGVISYRFWNRVWARSRSAVGSTMTLNGVPVTIVGVAPASFSGIEIGRTPDMWIQMGPTFGLTPWGVP
jgi:MacB-like periplasmic core domain